MIQYVLYRVYLCICVVGRHDGRYDIFHTFSMKNEYLIIYDNHNHIRGRYHIYEYEYIYNTELSVIVSGHLLWYSNELMAH